MFEIRSNCNVLKYCSVSNAWKSGGNIYAYMGEYEGGKYCSDELLGWRSNVYLNFCLSYLLHDELNDETFNVNGQAISKPLFPLMAQILILKGGRLHYS